MPLPEPLQKIGDEFLRYFGDRASTPPYMLYVYEPEAELAVRREMQDLVAYLTAHSIDVAAVSLAELFWQAVDASGFYEEIVEAEKANPGDPWALKQAHETLQEILTGHPSLADRVLAAVDGKPAVCCDPVSSRRPVPGVSHLGTAGRPPGSVEAACRPSLSRARRRRLRSEVHGAL